MSKIMSEQLLAGIILGDTKNKEYIYLPGGEVGTDSPYCIFEKNGERLKDLPLFEAVTLAERLHLKPARHPVLANRSYKKRLFRNLRKSLFLFYHNYRKRRFAHQFTADTVAQKHLDSA